MGSDVQIILLVLMTMTVMAGASYSSLWFVSMAYRVIFHKVNACRALGCIVCVYSLSTCVQKM